jgi:GTP:adenosylcobinamide-phosphate guanylyltransferase/adenylate cyclase class IV
MDMIKYGLILAGGKGTRMRPLTYTLPKPLVKIRNKALIDYVIDVFENVGIKKDNIFVSVDYLAHKIRAHFKKENINFIQSKGIAYSIMKLAEELNVPFVCTSSDILQSKNILKEAIDYFTNNKPAALAYYADSIPAIVHHKDYSLELKNKLQIDRIGVIYDSSSLLNSEKVKDVEYSAGHWELLNALAQSHKEVIHMFSHHPHKVVNTIEDLNEAKNKLQEIIGDVKPVSITMRVCVDDWEKFEEKLHYHGFKKMIHKEFPSKLKDEFYESSTLPSGHVVRLRTSNIYPPRIVHTIFEPFTYKGYLLRKIYKKKIIYSGNDAREILQKLGFKPTNVLKRSWRYAYEKDEIKLLVEKTEKMYTVELTEEPSSFYKKFKTVLQTFQFEKSKFLV